MNRLAGEKSPYLLQHASNPVDWRPWGAPAFAAAKAEDKPVFLSIGYSTCHWCHVMERESFEDEEVAALLNEGFVSIKVDREERPDLDDRFMTVCQMLTGSGGWPLTVFLTPDGMPFYAATYVPKETLFGRTGLLDLLPRIRALWSERRSDMESSAGSVAEHLAKIAGQREAGGRFSTSALAEAGSALAAVFDEENGGFGDAPKFPMPVVLSLLLRSWKRNKDANALRMAERSLAAMRNGGIYDHLGYGFHRYSTDAGWLVPHFEKMLYDQALLALAYTEGWQATGKELFRRTAREVCAYVLRDMRSPEGGFHSAEDADSEGVEGKFYLWSAAEIRSLLGEGAYEDLCRTYRVDAFGNFPEGREAGLNILHKHPDDESPAGDSERALFAARSGRVRPFKDDKILADWNGLMIAALARAGGAFADPELVHAAGRAADFILDRMVRGGRLLHRYRDGEAAILGFADDYAFLAWGLLELYEASFELRYLERAVELVDAMIAHHWDKEAGGLFFTADDAEGALSERTKPTTDGVLPSANSVGLLVLLKLFHITGDSEYRRKAEAVVGLYPSFAPAHAIGFAFFLSALDLAQGPFFQVVIAGDPERDDTRALAAALRRVFAPNKITLFRSTAAGQPEVSRIAPFTAIQRGLQGKATAYVCTDRECRQPTTEAATMLAQIEAG